MDQASPRAEEIDGGKGTACNWINYTDSANCLSKRNTMCCNDTFTLNEKLCTASFVKTRFAILIFSGEVARRNGLVDIRLQL